MYRNVIKCIHKDENYELIFNTKNKQIILLEKLFSQYVRESKNFLELKERCGVNDENIEKLENTYQYLVLNEFMISEKHECFEQKIFQWQEKTINLVADLSEIESIGRCIISNDLLINELVIIVKNQIDLVQKIQSIKTNVIELKKHVGIVTFIMSMKKENTFEYIELIKKLYNSVDMFVICILEQMDIHGINELLGYDINQKINYQIYIEDFLQYRDIYDYFSSIGKNITHSSKVYCYLFSFEGEQLYNVSSVVKILNNNVFCLSSTLQINSNKVCDIVPYTINNFSNDFLFLADEDIYEMPIKKCAQKCCYSDFCPYLSENDTCKYKEMLTVAIGLSDAN